MSVVVRLLNQSRECLSDLRFGGQTGGGDRVLLAVAGEEGFDVVAADLELMSK